MGEEMEPQAKLSGTDLMEASPQLDPNGHATAVMPIIWRPKQALIEQIKAAGFKRTALLIVVRTPRPISWDEYETTDYNETRRWLVPINRLAEYVSFSRPGVNEVCIVALNIRDDDDLERAHRLIKWDDEVLRQNGELRSITSLPHIDIGKVLEVTVDPGMFAPPPPAALNWLVKQFYETKPDDQCHFRQRLLLSFFIWSPLALTIGMACRLIIALASLILGLRDVEWLAGLNPFNMATIPWPQYGKYSVYIHNRHGSLYDFWLIGLLANPIVLVFGTLVVRAHFKLPWLNTLVTVAGSVAAWALLIIVVFGVFRFIYRPPSDERLEARRAREQQAAEQAEKIRLAQLDELVCRDRPLTLEALPPKYKTVSLRFNQLKARVCRPFAH
ncbi:MAG TPA: hypothetical protein VNG90_00225 [Candidatus Acidoferrum sp.]|nr:hypothetical protein [Candidatus Acidoferrum sp.]